MQLPHYQQVLESVRTYGPLLPVWMYLGAILDGSKRHLAALECGRSIDVVHLATEREAAQLLWSLHPVRAATMFARDRTLVELAELFAAPPREVRRVLNSLAPPPEKKYRRRDYTKRLTVRLDEDVQRILISFRSEYHVELQEVIAAAVRGVDPRKLREELRKIRERPIGRRAPRPSRRKSAAA